MQAPPNEIRHTFTRYKAVFDDRPRYNVSPSQQVAVALNDGRHEITQARWGLIPAWAKDVNPKIQPINARIETLTESRMIAPLLKRHRCLIFADGFFEWKRESSKKTPYFFRLKTGKPFAFAGLWTTWRDELTSCALITGQPNELVAPIHDRMPVMLDPDAAEVWASGKDAGDAQLELLRPYPAELMESYVVTSAVGKPSFDQPEATTSAA